MKRCLYLSWIIASSVFIVLLAVPALADSTEVDVSELITSIKKAILMAQSSSLKKPQMQVKGVTLDISCVVKKEGSGGVKFFVVTAEGKYATEVVQRMTFQLELVGKQFVESGVPFKGVVAGVDPTAGKIFVTSEGKGKAEAVTAVVNSDTKITDLSGNNKTLGDVKAGNIGEFTYGLHPDGSIDLKSITLGR